MNTIKLLKLKYCATTLIFILLQEVNISGVG